MLSQQGRGLDQHFTDDEMRAIVTTAHSLGLKVAAHAHGPRGIEAAARAGVDSIEHGSFTDEAGAKALAASGGWLVPTLLPFRATAERLGSGTYTPVVEAKVRPHVLHLDREVFAVELPFEDGTEGLVQVLGAVDFDLPAGRVCGREKRETLDVIPVRVGDEKVEALRWVRHEFAPEFADAGAGIEDELHAVVQH